MELSPTTAAVVASAVGLSLGAWLALVWRRARDTWRARAHNKRGQRAEQAAAKLLESRGYRILGRQARTTYAVRSNEAPQNIDLIIDFVVEKAGEKLAAEVKSAGAAVGIERADTRRQLLEYQLALGCKRTLLVDPERNAITIVEFPIPRPDAKPVAAPRPRSLMAPLIGLLIIAVVIVVLITLR
jgi:Holliday junction resolvase-like predicted endonuclease